MLVFCIEVLVHLAPEHLAGTLGIGIVERTAEAQPVVNVVGDGLMVDPALGIEFLIVGHGVVELRPYADHEAAAHLVHIVEHLLRIGIARGLEGVVAPRVELPVVPVLHDVVDRNLTLAELSQRLLDFSLRLVALAALPETEHPLGINGSLACQRAIA